MDQDYVDKKIDAKIIEINNSDNIYEIGTVVNVKEFIIEVTGINNVMFYEKINIANKALGYVNSINESSVTVAVLKIDSPINVGDMVYSTNTLYMGAYSPSSFGRVIDLFGVDKLSGRKYNDLTDIPIERKTIPIMDRGTVNRPLLTGIAGIDLMYPIGRGQRQLIIGDKRTGKTQIGLDAIVNQRGQNVLCFYVAIGKTKKEVKNIYNELMKKGALEYTTIITAFNDELPPVISLIPYFALSVAENYMMQGYDILVVIDDLKRHAEAYREISLISGKTPGRDAYPADIFYTHSRLLEKGCQHKNGGSITILPIVETKGGDITDYISTNVISITDGQIVLSDKAFQKGEKPAINYGLSVSRLGGAVQEKDMKAVGSVVRRKLLSYLETRSVYELVNMDEMSPELRNQFIEGKEILSKLLQYKFSPKTPQQMMAMFDDIVNGPKDPEKSKDDQFLTQNKDDSVFDRNNSDQFDEPGSAIPVPNADPNVDPNAPYEVTPSVEKDISAITDDGPVTAVSADDAITDPAFAVEEKVPEEEVAPAFETTEVVPNVEGGEIVPNVEGGEVVPISDNMEAASIVEGEDSSAVVGDEVPVIENSVPVTEPVTEEAPAFNVEENLPNEVNLQPEATDNQQADGFELPTMDTMDNTIEIPVTEMNVPVPETDFEEPVISMIIPEDATDKEVEDLILANAPTPMPKMNDILDDVELGDNVSLDVPGFETDKPVEDEKPNVDVDYDLGDVAFELSEAAPADKIEVASDDGIVLDTPTTESADAPVEEKVEEEKVEAQDVQEVPAEDDNQFLFSVSEDGEVPEEEPSDDLTLSGLIVRDPPDGEFEKDTDDDNANEVEEEKELVYNEEFNPESNDNNGSLEIPEDEEEVYSEEFEFDFPEEEKKEEKIEDTESTESVEKVTEDKEKVTEDKSVEDDLNLESNDDEVYSEDFEFDFPEVDKIEESVEDNTDEVTEPAKDENEFTPFEKTTKKKSNRGRKKKNSTNNKKKTEEEVI